MSLHLPWPSIRPISLATSSDGLRRITASGCRYPAWRLARLVCLGILGLVLASCQLRGNAPIVVKIGVIAPFEGIGRQLGYAILPGVRGELASANEARSFEPYRVALVALNDDLDPEEATAQARALARDPDVLAVIGLWSDATARSALPILQSAGVPTLLATPSSESGATIFSLCPAPDRVAAELIREAQRSGALPVVVTGPDNSLRVALLERSPGLVVVSELATHPCEASASANCPVIHTGDAVSSAGALSRWRAAGWEGPFIANPEAARPWFIEQAGTAAEGVRAVVCGSSDSLPPDQDASLQAAAGLASGATRLVLSGLTHVVTGASHPTRSNIAKVLSSTAVGQDLAWIEVRNGRWVPLHE